MIIIINFKRTLISFIKNISSLKNSNSTFFYLGNIIAALHIQVLKGDGVFTKQLICINRNKIDAKEAPQIMSTRSGCNSAQVLSWIQNSKLVPGNEKYLLYMKKFAIINDIS